MDTTTMAIPASIAGEGSVLVDNDIAAHVRTSQQTWVELRYNQNPELKWSTQNHVKN